MTKWVLIFVTIYTMQAEPEGSWKFPQVFKDINSPEECLSLAKKESEIASPFSHTFTEMYELPKDVKAFRAMPIKTITFRCLKEKDFYERMRRSKT